jgi:tRNA(adenine34) deaminase
VTADPVGPRKSVLQEPRRGGYLSRVTPEEMVSAALLAADEGLAAGELPIGAVVALGDDIVGRAFTQDKTSGRRLVHAELLAMVEADEMLGWARRSQPLRLAVNLEPCLMCLGAAMALGVSEVYFSLESPGDGAARIAATWEPVSADLPGYRAPAVVGGIRRADARRQFRRYFENAAESGFRTWAGTLADLPDPPPTP